MNRASIVLLLIMTLAVLSSAIGVVYAKHNSRKLFMELQELHTIRDALEVEWGQLQLEQSTLGRHGRVEYLARKRLGMKAPSPDTIVVVRLNP